MNPQKQILRPIGSGLRMTLLERDLEIPVESDWELSLRIENPKSKIQNS
jgi:hypothetical protein